jgi:hypothetical protein
LDVPGINDLGEVVFAKAEPGNKFIYSTTRGKIVDGGNVPAINNLGEIVFRYGQSIHGELRLINSANRL